MDNDKTYNGWRNYETWAVALWIDNEQGTHETRRAMAQQAWDESEDNENVPKIWTREQAARYTFADTLKDWVNEMSPDLGGTLWADLLGAALSEVDWNEIAENWLDGVEKEEVDAE